MAKPPPAWIASLRDRLERAERNGDAFPVSIKIRVTSGCFHREHSPHAYEIIDRHLSEVPDHEREFMFEEHESGPEIIVSLALATAALAFGKSVVDLITTIIKARSEGIRKGDRPSEPIELVLRNVRNGDEFHEEVVFRIGHNDSVSKDEIDDELVKALERLAKDAHKDGR